VVVVGSSAEGDGRGRQAGDGADDDVGPRQAGGDAPEVIDAFMAIYAAHGVEFGRTPIA